VVVSSDIPQIPGWSVARSADGLTWTAHRRDGLSSNQLEYGARLVVGANSLGELRVACLAEDVKAAFIATAEGLVHDMQEAELKRTADAKWEAADTG
jgi:hypothetical protein